jgi:hypothetical protein
MSYHAKEAAMTNEYTSVVGNFDGHEVGLLTPSQRYSTIKEEEACQL